MKLTADSVLCRDECEKLRVECEELRRTLASTISTSPYLGEESFQEDDEKVKYYTGISNFNTLMAIFSLVSSAIDNSHTSLSLFQQFILLFMKFRLNLGDQDLAYRFGVSQSTVTHYLRKWIDVMYVRWQFLVKWPDREQLLKTMHMEFRKCFGKCVAIIDCFEVFMKRPTNLKARAQTWSNYKHHNTAKFLIAICPQGVITFISKGWGGHVSYVYLTKNCGLLDKLLPGDVVLADRGFNIQDSVGLMCAKVKLPASTRGKKQLSKMEVDTSCQLARVRIHIEQVIGVVRQKYTILQSTLPVNFIMCQENESTSAIDKVVLICCALCNCCESVVPFD